MIQIYIQLNCEQGGGQSLRETEKQVPTSSPIVGGQNAEEWEFKYIVSLRHRSDPGFHYAAGTLVTDRWILTARHNLVKIFQDNQTRKINITHAFRVMAVPKYFNDLRRFRRLPKYPAEKTFCHPLPDTPDVCFLDADIGLIKLKDPIPLHGASLYNFTVTKMIEKSSDVKWEQKMKMAGWGYFNSSNPKISNKLLKADLQLYSADECARMVEDFRKYQEICAYEHGISGCSGDSGGPGMLPKIGSPDFVQVGIMSYSDLDCR